MSKLAQFPIPPQVRSSLLKNVPDMASMPGIDELEQLQNELKMLRQNAVARSKKASEDLRAIADSMKRLRDKEKGKLRAVDKPKRERDHTPSLYEERHYPGSKPRTGSQPLSSGRPPLDPRRSIDEHKKKKRKIQEVDPDSDGGHSAQRRKGSPAVSSGQSFSQKASKALPPSISTYPKVPHGTQDFSIPSPSPLLQPRPPIPIPPIPGPSKPTEVTEDFSKLKPPAHTLVTTFYSSIEPYLRSINEEDVGFLEYTGDELEPFVMPKLGVHYLEVWEEHDLTGRPIIPSKGKEAPASAFVAPKPTWDPSTLAEGDLLGEEKGHGPLTERVISALLPIPDASGKWKGVKAAEDAMEGRPGGSGAAAARRERLNVTDLENRIRDTMRFHGLLDTVQPDFSEKVDDPIATALRQAQSELRIVLATNKARKERLASIARDRLGYQEYLEIRDTIDKNITNLYAKLQKKDIPKLSKKKKKPLAGAAAASAEAKAARDAANGDYAADGTTPVPGSVPCPAALGMTADEDNRLTVNDQLKHLVETRRKWVEVVGAVFEEKQKMQPGRIWGFPKESVFADVEEEVRRVLGLEGAVLPAGFGTKGVAIVGGNGGGVKMNGVLVNGVHKDKAKAKASDAMDTS